MLYPSVPVQYPSDIISLPCPSAWLTTAAEAGLPYAMFNLGTLLDEGKGVAAPDYQAAAGWFMRAADAGRSGVYGVAAHNLCNMYTAGRGRGSVRTSTRPTLN